MSEFGDDMRELMAAHDYILLLARAGNPENPELAEVIAHAALSETLNLH